MTQGTTQSLQASSAQGSIGVSSPAVSQKVLPVVSEVAEGGVATRPYVASAAAVPTAPPPVSESDVRAPLGPRPRTAGRRRLVKPAVHRTYLHRKSWRLSPEAFQELSTRYGPFDQECYRPAGSDRTHLVRCFRSAKEFLGSTLVPNTHYFICGPHPQLRRVIEKLRHLADLGPKNNGILATLVLPNNPSARWWKILAHENSCWHILDIVVTGSSR